MQSHVSFVAKLWAYVLPVLAAMRFAHGVASSVDLLLSGSTHPDPAVHGLFTVCVSVFVCACGFISGSAAVRLNTP